MKKPPFTLIAGPCIIEDEGFILEISDELKKITTSLGVNFLFKASFDKANRSSVSSFRGPGLKKGLEILAKAKSKSAVKILTDFHTPDQADEVAAVADCIQVPAFLCRQTDMIEAAVRAVRKTGGSINVKKGQFLAPWDMKNVADKIQITAKELGFEADYYFTERGVVHGYNRLVVDMISFRVMKEMGANVVFDATHSVQLPGAGEKGKSSGGERDRVPELARAAIAAGADGIFLECHPNPKKALSDKATSLPLGDVELFVKELKVLHAHVNNLNQFQWGDQ